VSLAEEYRRQGRHQDARSVLETSLKSFPQHLSALVALGRVRLEGGDPEGAAQVLEKVLERDPMQLVANKMLAQAYLDLGRSAEAEQRLRIYALLNDRDPELLALQRRLRQAAAPAPVPVPVPIPEVAPVPPAPPVAPRPALSRAEDVVFDLGPSLPPHIDLGLLETRADGELFAGLGGPEALARYRAAWRDGEVFGSAGVGSSRSDEVPAATVTLGELYLRQGHRAEAAGMFTEVLRHEPWNDAAQSGLQEARAPSLDPRAARLSAFLERVRQARATPGRADVR
jgi:tetratricopeptide (TPR) repeat protein